VYSVLPILPAYYIENFEWQGKASVGQDGSHWYGQPKSEDSVKSTQYCLTVRDGKLMKCLPNSHVEIPINCPGLHVITSC
jgi:hypothetical protein